MRAEESVGPEANCLPGVVSDLACSAGQWGAPWQDRSCIPEIPLQPVCGERAHGKMEAAGRERGAAGAGEGKQTPAPFGRWT